MVTHHSTNSSHKCLTPSCSFFLSFFFFSNQKKIKNRDGAHKEKEEMREKERTKSPKGRGSIGAHSEERKGTNGVFFLRKKKKKNELLDS